MEAIQSTTYCAVCLKCSTSQPALRPLRHEWKKSSTTFAQVCAQVAFPFLFCPLRYLSLSHSLTTPPALPLHPSIPLPLSGEEKQTAVRVRLADEFQMTLKGRGADQLSPEGRPVTNMRPRACKQAHKNHQINVATRTHTNVDCSCSLNRYCILSQPTVKVKEVCVVCVDLWTFTHTSCT